MKLVPLVVLVLVIVGVATFAYYWTFLSVSITDLELWKGLLYVHFWVYVRNTPINVTFDITVHDGDRVIHHVYETEIFIPVFCNLTGPYSTEVVVPVHVGSPVTNTLYVHAEVDPNGPYVHKEVDAIYQVV